MTFQLNDIVLVKKRKGHLALLATILHVSGDSVLVRRSDGAIRTYALKNVTRIASGDSHATHAEHELS